MGHIDKCRKLRQSALLAITRGWAVAAGELAVTAAQHEREADDLIALFELYELAEIERRYD